MKQHITQQWALISRSITFCAPKFQIPKLISLKGFMLLVLMGASLSISVSACSTANSSDVNNVEVTLVSNVVTRAAFKQIIPKFTTKWKQKYNQNVTFNESYGASSSQARAVINGLEADVVILPLPLDIQKIEKAGLIQPGWEKEAPNNAIVTKSVAVFVTRNGNPKRIETWTDLIRDDVSVITANPKTSGGARWNFLALWGSAVQNGRDDAKALEYTTKVYKNVPVLPKDAREASDVFFNQGQGDVLINYENEVFLALANGEKLSYEVPNVNISIDNPVAVIDKNVDKHNNRKVAEAFVKYLFTLEAQREFTKLGFRPVDPTVEKEVGNKYPKIKTLFTAQKVGGSWDAIQRKFFEDSAIFDQIQASVRQ